MSSAVKSAVSWRDAAQSVAMQQHRGSPVMDAEAAEIIRSSQYQRQESMLQANKVSLLKLAA